MPSSDSRNKLMSLPKLLRLRRSWARRRRRVVFTNGVFDLLHAGHVELLQKAKRLGGALVVGVNSDASVRRLGKGPDRPFNRLHDRMRVLAALSCVDAVASFPEDTPERLIRAIKPDVLVKGADYQVEQVAGRAHAGKVVLLPLKNGYSTTALARKLGLRKLSLRSALILLNGELKNPEPVRRLARQVDAVLCADGALRHARRLGIKSPVVVGDMDSLPRHLERLSGVRYLCDFDQNLSDFEKTLLFALKRGCREIFVAGGLGGRVDHQLVNLGLAERYSKEMAISFVGGQTLRLAGPGRHLVSAKPGQCITLLPSTATARLSTSGLRYRLKGELLTRGSRGLSNQALSARVLVRVHSGRAWIIQV